MWNKSFDKRFCSILQSCCHCLKICYFLGSQLIWYCHHMHPVLRNSGAKKTFSKKSCGGSENCDLKEGLYYGVLWFFEGVTKNFWRNEKKVHICSIIYQNMLQRIRDCNGTRTHSHLVRKQILNHLAKLDKYLSCVVSTYLYDSFDFMFLSCHVRVSEWIHTL